VNLKHIIRPERRRRLSTSHNENGRLKNRDGLHAAESCIGGTRGTVDEANMLDVKAGNEILIAGAGPSGLALTVELTRRGANPVIIDRQAAGANTSRACVVHARTMEVLEPLGVTPDLLAEGVKVPIFRIRDRDRLLLTIDFSDIPSCYRFTLMIPQNRIEQILLQHLEKLGRSVVRPCELISYSASASQIEAQVQANGSTQSIRAKWLIGCDGMHSRVREQSGIAFSGGEYEASFVLADVHMQWPLSRNEVTLFYSPKGFVVVAPLPDDRFRIVATVDEAPEVPSLEFMQTVLDARGPTTNPGRIDGVAWSSRFHIHHRVAQNPRKGRVLLCGDAAHVHSPAGGQGMNTGIQDSISLAEALIITLQDADEARLDAWAAQRHKVASEVVTLTDRMTRVATMKSATGQALRNLAVAFAGHLPPLRAAVAKTLAELDAR
jgi:2-polyprenyl-6-methoxyphenol hydroxylase-like FAD-dependent oxidoreductase